MTFFEHLEELRGRLVITAVAVLVAAGVAFYFAPDILKMMKHDLPRFRLTYRSVLEPFMVRIKLSIMGGIILALPVVLYQTFSFLSPALDRREKRMLYPIVLVMFLLFLGGAGLGYFYVLPMGVKWLMEQGVFLDVTPILSVSDFVNFVTLFILGFGVAFETPLVMFTLMRLGIIKRETMRKNWRQAYVVIMVAAAIATPDWSVPPMIILSVSMILLYELTLLFVRK